MKRARREGSARRISRAERSRSPTSACSASTSSRPSSTRRRRRSSPWVRARASRRLGGADRRPPDDDDDAHLRPPRRRRCTSRRVPRDVKAMLEDLRQRSSTWKSRSASRSRGSTGRARDRRCPWTAEPDRGRRSPTRGRSGRLDVAGDRSDRTVRAPPSRAAEMTPASSRPIPCPRCCSATMTGSSSGTSGINPARPASRPSTSATQMFSAPTFARCSSKARPGSSPPISGALKMSRCH